MSDPLQDVTIVGIHPVEPSDEAFDEAIEIQWGDDLEGEEREAARQQLRDLFAHLFLIELRIDPPEADVDWGSFTQSQDDLDESEWQVAYDERPVDEEAGTWAFFLHQVDLARALETPAGPRQLPAPTPCPEHLQGILYEVP